MGCWNGTCGVSRLPIQAGDPIVLFPLLLELPNLERFEMGGGFCYAHDLAQPLTPGIRGVYNDYGGIEDLTGETLPLLQAYFANNAAEFLSREGEPADIDLTSLETVLNEGIERGELFNEDLDYSSGEVHLRPLGLMLVHANIHDELISTLGNRASWRTPEMTVRQALEAQLAPRFKAPKREAKQDHARRAIEFSLHSTALYTTLAKPERLMREFVDGTTDGGGKSKGKGKAESKKVLAPAAHAAVVDLMLFAEVLTELRTPWNYQCGAGSQSAVSKTHSVLVECMQGHLSRLAEEDEEFDEA